MKLTHNGARFVFACAFTEKDTAKTAGFRWDPTTKEWWTDDAARAARLRGYADEVATEALASAVKALEASRATDAAVDLPVPTGLTYLPFQRAGIVYALDHPSTLFADEMGLGKTIEALGVINADPTIESVLVVCPASLKLNWKREAERWLVRPGLILVGASQPIAETFDGLFISRAFNEQERPRRPEHRKDINPTSQAPAPLGLHASDARVGLQDPKEIEPAHPGEEIDRRLARVRDAELPTVSPGPTDPALPINDPGDVGPDGRILGNAQHRLPTSDRPQRLPAEPAIMVSNRRGPEAQPLGGLQNREALRNLPEDREKPIVCDPRRSRHLRLLILNYDVLHRWETLLASATLDILIIDEAHYIKNPKARRSKQVYSLARIPRRRLFLTGTPIVNRPAELWPIINCLDPVRWPKFFPFAKRYCNAYHNGWGWDFSGAAHLEELQDRLRASIMVRRLKADVLTELPAKRRQVIELAANGAAVTVRKEREAYERHQAEIDDLRVRAELAKADGPEEYAAAVRALSDRTRAAFTEIARLRHETALAKVPAALEHLDVATESGKVVCFAHHHDVVAAIEEHFVDRCVVVTGETPLKARQEAVDAFQTNPEVSLFIGSIGAAGVGITLTAASHVIFAELDWVPGNMTQAEDRLHRIGQRESVLVQHLVLDGSIDAHLAKTLIAKQEVIDRALDDETMIPVVPGATAATADAKPSKLDEEAAKLSAEEIAAVHEKLRFLAGCCDGAAARDDAGFNRLDTRIGKHLAQLAILTPRQAVLGARIVHKYRRQLGEGKETS